MTTKSFFVFLLLLLSPFVGCGKRRVPVVSPSATGPHAAPVGSSLPATMPHSAPVVLTAIDRARSLISEGKLSEATRALELLLSSDEAKTNGDLLLFELALLYAHQSNPLYDLKRAKNCLDKLISGYALSPYRPEAEALMAIINELVNLREASRAQDARIKQLNYELEKLKQIDLRRKRN